MRSNIGFRLHVDVMRTVEARRPTRAHAITVQGLQSLFLHGFIRYEIVKV